MSSDKPHAVDRHAVDRHADQRAADQRARLLAQRELSRPLVIEAGAGTGKTATLVARVLAWCLGPGWSRAESRLAERHAAQGGGPGAGNDPGTDTERVASLVLGGVVAITFTEAAAAEMADRVTSGLAQITRGELPVGYSPPEEPGSDQPGPGDLDAMRRSRARALLAAVDHLEVRTIHAFCRQLLAEHPFEARIHPSFTVDADGSTRREIVEEVVEAALGEAYGEPGDPDFLTLATLGRGPLEISELVDGLAQAGYDAEILAEDPFGPAHLGPLAERLRRTADELFDLLDASAVAGTRAKNAAKIHAGLAELRERLDTGDWSSTAALDKLRQTFEIAFPKTLEAHLGKWARGETANQKEAELLADALLRLAPLAGRFRALHRHVLRLDPELLGAARRVAGPLLGRVRETLRRRGVLSFSDLLRGARDLLVGNPPLLAQVRRRIDQLLVDEFQDTDRLQCDIVRRLALEGPPAERPGLFVVGDPKQSIYGWRSADLAAYEAFVAEVTAAGGERLPLVVNFRSVPAVLDEVERVTAPVMLRERGLQPEFRPLLACDRLAEAPGHAVAPRGPVEHWISWLPHPEDDTRPGEGKVRPTGELEARALAADLVGLRQETGLPWSDVGVLFRSLTNVEVYLTALREAGVPYLVSRDRQYYRRREILDAAALVRTVLSPEDRLALITFLRSSAVGVPDAALLPFAAAGIPERLAALDRPDPARLAELRATAENVARDLARRGDEIPGIERIRGWHHGFVHAATVLAELRRAFAEEAIDVFVDRLRRFTLFEAIESARYLGVFRQANLDRFMTELLLDLEAENGDRHRVLRRLRRRLSEGFEAEEARPDETADDAVRVMTIHKAKGLEFRHVYLLEMHKSSGRNVPPELEIDDLPPEVPPTSREVGGTVEYRLFGAATPGFDRLTAHREAVGQAELVRTLYVALTRASERLVVVGRRSLKKTAATAKPVARAATHLDLLLHRDGPAPTTDELCRMWADGEEHRLVEDVLWRLPGRTPPDPDALERPPGPSLPELADVRALHEHLVHARRAAEEHQKRPFRQIASKVDGITADNYANARGGADPDEAEADRRTSVTFPPPEDNIRPSREAAMAAGSAIHHALETFDLQADPAAELARQGRLLGEHVELFAESENTAAARERAEHLWRRFTEGELGHRFVALREHIVARELPVLLAPSANDDAVGFLAGTIDLVVRDAQDGAPLLIIDFKTDLIDPSTDLDERVRRYAAQGDVYVRAVHDALGLDTPPRFELWFLDADRAVEASSPSPPSLSSSV